MYDTTVLGVLQSWNDWLISKQKMLEPMYEFGGNRDQVEAWISRITQFSADIRPYRDQFVRADRQTRKAFDDLMGVHKAFLLFCQSLLDTDGSPEHKDDAQLHLGDCRTPLVKLIVRVSAVVGPRSGECATGPAQDDAPIQQHTPSGGVMESQRELIRLHEILAKRFEVEELRTLCFRLGIDYDDLKGEGKSSKARELVAFLERRGRVEELVAAGKRLRPDVAWDANAAAVPPPTSSPYSERLQNTDSIQADAPIQPRPSPTPLDSPPPEVTPPPPVTPPPDPLQPIRDQVFISYSHKDKRWLEQLQTMLAPLVREGALNPWDDTKIKPGSLWEQEIEKALARAKVAVLLVSKEFLASDFIADHDLPPMLAATKQEKLTILWIPVSHCLYEETEIVHYQPASDPLKPLDSLSPSERDKVLKEICQKIKQAAGYS